MQLVIVEQALHDVDVANTYPELHFVHVLPSVAHVAHCDILLEQAGQDPLDK